MHYVFIKYSIIREYKGNYLGFVTYGDFGGIIQHLNNTSKNSAGRL